MNYCLSDDSFINSIIVNNNDTLIVDLIIINFNYTLNIVIKIVDYFNYYMKFKINYIIYSIITIKVCKALFILNNFNLMFKVHNYNCLYDEQMCFKLNYEVEYCFLNFNFLHSGKIYLNYRYYLQFGNMISTITIKLILNFVKNSNFIIYHQKNRFIIINYYFLSIIKIIFIKTFVMTDQFDRINFIFDSIHHQTNDNYYWFLFIKSINFTDNQN